MELRNPLLPQAHAGALAVLIDEDDAGSFKGSLSSKP